MIFMSVRKRDYQINVILAETYFRDKKWYSSEMKKPLWHESKLTEVTEVTEVEKKLKERKRRNAAQRHHIVRKKRRK